MNTISAYCGECGTFTPVSDAENCICPQCGHKINLPDKLPAMPACIDDLKKAFKNKLGELGLVEHCFFDEDVKTLIIVLPAYKVKASGSINIESTGGKQSRDKLNVDFVSGFQSGYLHREDPCEQLQDLSFCYNTGLLDLSKAPVISFNEWFARNKTASGIEIVELTDKKDLFATEGILNNIRAVALQSLDAQQISKVETRVDELSMDTWSRYVLAAKITIKGLDYAAIGFPETGEILYNPELQEGENGR